MKAGMQDVSVLIDDEGCYCAWIQDGKRNELQLDL